ncbi:unnamed protein product [Psylliodes chrysocephalus]|uniref:Gag-like protein n=1 Tax=Psylliodes chrysocephalus TaxID=3402493 RepID=A0A9P0CXS4_9CUCU|nr:unnamed protein product [Psylliodes chrysocephala]
MSNINPTELNIKVSKAKNTRDDRILVGCSKNEDAPKFEDAANPKLSDAYEVKDIKSRNPKIRIVGMIEKHEPDELISLLKYQNDGIQSSRVCSVVKIWATKKNDKMHQTTLEIDAETYVKAMSLQSLFVGWDVCSVFDAIDITLCYKCSGFGHNQGSCLKNIACPKCSRPHQFKDCPVEMKKCIMY